MHGLEELEAELILIRGHKIWLKCQKDKWKLVNSTRQLEMTEWSVVGCTENRQLRSVAHIPCVSDAAPSKAIPKHDDIVCLIASSISCFVGNGVSPLVLALICSRKSNFTNNHRVLCLGIDANYSMDILEPTRMYPRYCKNFAMMTSKRWWCRYGT